MSAPQSLLQATLNRLSARLRSGLADTLAGLVALAEEAPERLQQEWGLFVQEVELEADRLERGGEEAADPAAAAGAVPSPGDEPSPTPARPAPSPQEQIDALRARVARLSARLEDRP
jgi:hypothetical protein